MSGMEIYIIIMAHHNAQEYPVTKLYQMNPEIPGGTKKNIGSSNEGRDEDAWIKGTNKRTNEIGDKMNADFRTGQ